MSLFEHALPIISVCLAATVFGLLLAQGLMVGPADVARSFREVRLLARAFVAAHVAVPLLTLLALWALRPQRNVAITLAVLASCPVAPLMIVRISRAGCRLAEIMTLHLALTVLGVVMMPFTLQFMAYALDFRAEVNVIEIARRVLWMLVMPLVGGVGLRLVFPRIAAAIAQPLGRSAGVILVGLILALTGLMLPAILQTGASAYLTIASIVAASLAAGHLIAPRAPTEQLIIGMLSAGRHLGVALLIAASNFATAKVLPVLIPYLLVFIVVSTVYVRWRSIAIVEPRSCADLNRDDMNPFASTSHHPLGVSP